MHTKGGLATTRLLRRVLRRVLDTAFEKVPRRVLRRCLAVGFRGKKGSMKGLSRRHLEKAETRLFKSTIPFACAQAKSVAPQQRPPNQKHPDLRLLSDSSVAWVFFGLRAGRI